MKNVILTGPPKQYLREVFLWLFVINLGIAFGAGIYEARVVIPHWADLPPRTWPNTGIMFWVYVTTIPLTLLTVVNLIGAWTDASARRKWWFGAAALIVLERAVTFSYFIPAMIRMTSSELSDAAEVKASLSQWLFFNHGRHALTFVGWLLALKALTLHAEHTD